MSNSATDLNLRGIVSTNKTLNLMGTIGTAGTPSGTKDYNKLNNKPSINGVELVGNLEFEDLGDKNISTSEIDTLVEEVFG